MFVTSSANRHKQYCSGQFPGWEDGIAELRTFVVKQLWSGDLQRRKKLNGSAIEKVINFIKDKVVNSYGEVPSDNLFIGFGLINMIGKIIDKYGNYFQFGLRNENFIQGDVFEGFKYDYMNDNQFVPILKIIDSELKIDNQEE